MLRAHGHIGLALCDAHAHIGCGTLCTYVGRTILVCRGLYMTVHTFSGVHVCVLPLQSRATVI